jgi:3-deoxy-D-manno-octulosonate 8-phosphate phosphatase (KDO 8-P phosphatase)
MATASLTATERARRVKLMIFDVDGVLTDGGLMFTAEGDTMKSFNSMDGHGAKLLREAGIDTAIILYQGIENKPEAFADLLKATGMTPEECGYMGDDWVDLGVMLRVGFAAAPANSHPEVIARAHWVSEARGGHGAVREVCDTLLRAQNKYDALLAAACAGGQQQGLVG